ncbi:MAG: hypothetical protein SFV18_13580 [Bryobacteraceae bacterium]|nr:hypothetical protein [Bryobacteraceae bacterium]
MRIFASLTASLVLAGGAFAAGPEASPSVGGQRELVDLSTQRTDAAMYIWAERYVYQPGEQLTLRGTVRPNNDLYPYTLFAFRVNNQTGVKSFLPNGTTTVTDIYGNTQAQGFRVGPLPALDKAVLVGAGGVVTTSPVTIPQELGMHTIVFQVRDFTGTRVIKSAYFKIGVVEQFVNVSGAITSDTTWVNTRAYRLTGIVYVRSSVLTIQPGTFVLGQPSAAPNPSTLVVTNTGRINASGTKSRPIIMTSSRNVGQRERGDWGGLILIGNAPINTPGGSANIEGLPDSPETRYGGTDATYNCGTLRYVRVEFAGSVLGPANEVNGITWGGCGSQTVSEYLQVHYGLDDAFEWFGGNNDGKYLVGSYTQDDYLDWQTGWTGRLQHAVMVATPTAQSNRGIEADNLSNPQDATPRSRPILFNVTFVGNGNLAEEDTNANAGIWLRRGTGGSLNNILITNWNQTGIEARDTATAAQMAEGGALTINGLLMWNNGQDRNKPNTVEGQTNSANTPAEVAAALLALVQRPASQTLVADPLLRRPLASSDPDFRPGLGSPVFRANWVQPPDNGFWDQNAHYIGAFGEIDWTEEWTWIVIEPDVRP